MALTSRGWELSVSLMDRGASTATKQYRLRATDAETARADAAIIVAALDGVTNSVIISYRVTEVFMEYKFEYPESTIRNVTKASLSFRVGYRKINDRIPSPVNDIFQAPIGQASNIVKIKSPELVAYAAIFGEGGQAYISKHKQDATLVSGKRK